MEINKFIEDVIDLRRYHNKENLESIISKKIPNIKKSSIFDIKMEIKKLSNICSKSLDLRYINEDITYTSYEYGDLVHYLDEKALEIFKRELRIYNGVYTEGVYNVVLKESTERLEEEKNKKYLNILDFSDVKQRKEERMNYTVMLDIYSLKNQSQEEIESFFINKKDVYKKSQGVSINISENGLKIKTKKDVDYNVEDIIFVEFDKKKILYNENIFYIAYKIKKIEKEKEKDFIYYSLKKLDEAPFMNKDFDNDLKIFIKENKEKYKIELSNIEMSARLKTYEQAYLQNIKTLPLYFKDEDLKYAFVSNGDNKLINYFENENEENILSNILESFDLSIENKKKIYFMCFKIKKNEKIYFFTKKIDLKKEEEMIKMFSLYGSKKNTFKIFKLNLINIEKKEYLSKISLPEKEMEKINYSNYLITQNAEKKLKDINKIGLLTDISDSSYKLKLSNIKIEDRNFNKLRKFQIQFKNIKNFEIIEDESYEKRKDDRFIIKEDIYFRYKEKKRTGKTNNISINGLQLIVDEYISINEGEVILLNFKNLENQGLISVKYRVVKKTGQLLSLKLLQEDNYQIVQDYFRKYIKTQINSIKPIGFKSNLIGLSKGLRNIYLNNHLETPCLFHVTKNNDIKKYDIIISKQSKDILNILNEKQLKKMLHSDKLKDYLLDKYNKMKEKETVSVNVFIKLIGKKEVIKFENELKDEISKYTFLEGNDNTTFCFNVLITKSCKKFNNKYFKDELEYIKKYSDLKANGIKNEENIISGILKIQNITEIKKQKLKLILK